MQDELDILRKKLKAETGKTQGKLAADLKVSASWLNKFLRGDTSCTNPRFSTLQRMRKYTSGGRAD